MSDYDRKVLDGLADNLETRSKQFPIVLALMALIVGVGLGVALAAVARASAFSYIVVCGVYFAALGFVVGKEKSFGMRLKAQELRCQAQIEANMRGSQGEVAVAGAR